MPPAVQTPLTPYQPRTQPETARNGLTATYRSPESRTTPSPKSDASTRWSTLGLVGLRLAIGFEFLWAFFDKTFGLGYATSSAHAWINGGSPTTGFLTGATAGPLSGVFASLAGVAAVDWLFMIGLLGIGLGLVFGTAVRPAAICGAVMLALMYLAVWAPATMAGGQPTGSTNPIVDEHIVGILGLIVVAALARRGTGYLGRVWASLPIVKDHASLV